ncbi:MAG: hypothetical protein HY744_01520 [Deltaproteobacteria bacterium]|nr:hypothetical protein [Deltaproteobacteria bacterium]
MRRLLALLAAGSLGIAGPARAGALDRFEQAHRPRDAGESKDDKGKADEERGSSSPGDEGEPTGSGEGAAGDVEPGDGSLALLMLCFIPPLPFACFLPPHRVAAEPYGGERLYLEPMVVRDENGEEERRVYRPADERRMRWGEIGIQGYRALNEPVVYAHDLAATLWLGPVVVRGGWEHFYEKLPEDGGWDHLDVVRAALGANMLGPAVDSLEAYLLLGGSLLHGEAWTPAFDAGLDLRIYPHEPLAIDTAATLSFFEVGPVLLDLRVGLGVALGAAEIRVGPRWLYQGDAQGFWGPAASVLGRF